MTDSNTPKTEPPKIDAATIARFVVLLLSLINTTLVMFGIDTIPIADETVNQFVALTWQIGAALWAWYEDSGLKKLFHHVE